MVTVTQADRDAVKAHQQRFLTEGTSESALLAEAFARYREEACRQLEADKAELVEALDDALCALWQYKDDLHFPPSPDSMGRRLARISEVAAKIDPLLSKHGGSQ